MSTHTKGPLSIRRSCRMPTVIGADRKCVASLGSSYSCRPLEEIEANAERIVLAWNCFDDMLAALKAQGLADAANEQRQSYSVFQDLENSAKALRVAAIAKAEGRA
jgi:hypothetical protein